MSLIESQNKVGAVRYIVNDVDASVDFYTKKLGFNVDMHVPEHLPVWRWITFGFLLTGQEQEAPDKQCQMEQFHVQVDGIVFTSKWRILYQQLRN